MTNSTHGMSRHSAFKSWEAMMQRCFNPRCKDFKDYGARGVTVCERWHDPANFCADMGTKPYGKTLGRVENGGHYEPGNCEWQTAREQGANKRNNRVPGGLAAAARAAGMAESTLRNRLNKGMSLDDAVSAPNERPRMVPGGMSALARAAGLKRETVRERIKRGWTLNTALSQPAHA